MTTLSLGHDVSECVFMYFGLVSSNTTKVYKKFVQKSLNHPKKIIVRAPHTPKCLGAVVPAHCDRALSHQLKVGEKQSLCVY